MNPYIDLLNFVLSELLVTHFDLAGKTTKNRVLHLYFEEKIDDLKTFSPGLIIFHGFHKEITIQDFTL